MPIQKLCFIVSPIGEAGTPTRKRSDQVLRHILTPAAKECGYEVQRADKLSEPGIITSQIIQHIVKDDLVIADLTGMNPNVFYELAIRHAVRKPLVQIIQKREKIPFDVAGMRTIQVDHNDLDSADEAKAEIIKQIHAVEHKSPPEIESPISASLQLQTLQESDQPQDRTLADILSALSQLRTEVAEIRNTIRPPIHLRYLAGPTTFEYPTLYGEPPSWLEMAPQKTEEAKGTKTEEQTKRAQT